MELKKGLELFDSDDMGTHWIKPLKGDYSWSIKQFIKYVMQEINRKEDPYTSVTASIRIIQDDRTVADLSVRFGWQNSDIEKTNDRNREFLDTYANCFQEIIRENETRNKIASVLNRYVALKKCDIKPSIALMDEIMDEIRPFDALVNNMFRN